MSFLQVVGTIFFLLLTCLAPGEEIDTSNLFENLGSFQIKVPKHVNEKDYFASQCSRTSLFFAEDKAGFYQLADAKRSIYAGDRLTVTVIKTVGEPNSRYFKEYLLEQKALFFALGDWQGNLKNMPADKRNKQEILWKNSKKDLGVPFGFCFFNGGSQPAYLIAPADWGIYSNLDGLNLQGITMVMIFHRVAL